jgi:hypothetical protein
VDAAIEACGCRSGEASSTAVLLLPCPDRRPNRPRHGPTGPHEHHSNGDEQRSITILGQGMRKLRNKEAMPRTEISDTNCHVPLPPAIAADVRSSGSRGQGRAEESFPLSRFGIIRIGIVPLTTYESWPGAHMSWEHIHQPNKNTFLEM